VTDVAATQPDERPAAVAWPVVGTVAAVVGLVLLLLSTRYGYHRDELYFVAAGAHPAWGYPDQPPLTPLVAWTSEHLGGGNLVVFRLPATLVAVVVTVLGALIARELGGRRFAQGLAAFATGTATYVLLSGHLLVTSTVDLLVWVVVTWLVVRILRTGDARLWLAVGVVTGLGLWNKQLPVVLVAGLLVGMALTRPARHWLRSPWWWGGLAIAAVMWVPVLVWQATHGWPQLTLARQISAEYGTAAERVNYVVLQVVLFSLGATVLWVTGVVRLWRDEAWAAFRVLAWAWLVVVVAFAVTAGQGYYPAGMYPALIAAGSVVAERWRVRWAVVALVAVSSLLLLPAALPVLSPARLAASPWDGLGEQLRETAGWPQLAAQVAAAYDSVPAGERPGVQVVTDNYGEAGAIDRYGPDLGLPAAWSGHNGFGLWGPPPPSPAPVVVVWEDSPPSDFFSGCRLIGPVTGPVENEESTRASVYVCSGPIGGWAQTWPRIVHLSS
jgi:4-amino-4-deoxy-L-arabinose transferase-like glycosyltransferase